jgi:cell wall assembly regulator SMI1
MTELWQRIENWLRSNAPSIAQGLNPPASIAEIQSTEKLLGIQFPDDVRQSYLLHNGQSQESPPMLEGWEWLSLERIRDEWTVWNELLQGGDFEGLENESDGQLIVTDWWHPKWIPLTYSGAGDHHCLDMNPGPQGKIGQIIEMWHDDGERPWIAASFREWISSFADELERGEYVLSEEYGSLCRVEDLE